MKTYFIDTNYFLRLLLKDNDKQFRVVYELFQKAIKSEVKIVTSVIVFFEIYWVLFSFYKKNKEKILFYLGEVLKMIFLEIENREVLEEAVNLFQKTNLDLEDCYNLSYYKNISGGEFASFNKGIMKIVKDVE